MYISSAEVLAIKFDVESFIVSGTAYGMILFASMGQAAWGIVTAYIHSLILHMDCFHSDKTVSFGEKGG